MNKKLKLIFFFIGFSVLLLIFNINRIQATYYVWKTHGNFVTLKKLEDNRLELGYARYEATPINNKHMQFEVIYDYESNEFTDNYKYGVETLKEEEKLNKVAKDILKLGFKQDKLDESNYLDLNFYVQEGKNSILLSLNDSEEIFNFKEQKYLDLIRLIRNSGAEINDVAITVPITLDNPNEPKEILSLNANIIKNVSTKDEFIRAMVPSNSMLASHYTSKKWSKELRKLENERFQFKYNNGMDIPYPYNLNCSKINENMECVEAFIYVTYQKDGLNLKNRYLKQDLEAIINVFENVIKPKPKWKVLICEEGTLKELSIVDTDVRKYKNIDEFFVNLKPLID